MTLSSFEVMMTSAENNVDENDRVWFPKWLRRYVMMFRNGDDGRIDRQS
ncbi:hypothetical protein [Stieleria varia]|uniref:Uncharacterized protein n=1 Tax=Stieleria varia TaxID=2528005 RepID=A0A5C6B816_9BACT|nr:hypothetical protein [Stieleria varia]TWU07429.1 hypothetical protein Pla52n_00020 [Stieleria varia]